MGTKVLVVLEMLPHQLFTSECLLRVEWSGPFLKYKRHIKLITYIKAIYSE